MFSVIRALKTETLSFKGDCSMVMRGNSKYLILGSFALWPSLVVLKRIKLNFSNIHCKNYSSFTFNFDENVT